MQAEVVDGHIDDLRRRVLILGEEQSGVWYRCKNDTSWTMLDIDPAIMTITGYQAHELIGNRILSYGDLIHPDDRASIDEAIQKALSKGNQFRLRYRIIDREGRVRWLWEQGSRLSRPSRDHQTLDDTQRDDEHILEGFITDITNIVENDLHQQKLQRIVSESGMVIVTWDTEVRLTIADITTTVETVFGYSRSQLLSQELSYFHLIHPDDRARVVDKLGLLFQETEIDLVEQEYRVLGHDGSYLWIHDRTVCLRGFNGAIIQLFGVLSDLSGLKRTEYALKKAKHNQDSLIDAAPVPIYTLSPDGIVLSWNPAAERLFGWAPHEVIGRRLPSVPDARDTEFQNLLRRSLQGEPLSGIELQRERKDGSRLYVNLYASPMKNVDDQISSVLILLDDVTEQRTVALRLLKDQMRLTSLVELMQSDESDVQRFLDRALAAAIRFTESTYGFICLYHEDAHMLELSSVKAYSSEVPDLIMPYYLAEHHDSSESASLIPLDHCGFWGDAIQLRMAVNSDSTMIPERSREMMSTLGIDRYLSIPIYDGERIVALAGFTGKTQEYDETDTLQLILLLDSMWKVVERIRSRKVTEHLNSVLRAIYAIQQLIFRMKDPDELSERIVDVLTLTKGYMGAVIQLIDPGTELDEDPVVLHTAASQVAEGFHQEITVPGVLIPCTRWYREQIKQGATVLHEERLSRCKDCPVPIRDSRIDTIETMCIALRYESFCYGYLTVGISRGLGNETEEIELFESLAGDIAYAINTMHVRKEKQLAENDRDRYQDQLLQVQKMEAVGRLAGGIAHDFNNILAVIIGYGELVLDTILPEDQNYTSVSEMLAAAVRAKDLTTQLLAYSRKQILDSTILDVNVLIEHLKSFLQRLVGEDVRLALVLDDDPCMVEVDRSQMEQILMNLVVNARDAMPLGGELTIRTAIVDTSHPLMQESVGVRLQDPCVLIQVEDSGVGMDSETVKEIFEPFFTTKSRGSGTGLGLATVYGIVRQHAGNILVHSEVDAGSVFSILLPYQQRTGDSQGLGFANEYGRQGAVSDEIREVDGDRRTILLVEDEESVRTIVAIMLTQEGYRVIVAQDPTEAIDLATMMEQPLDLLITDVIMPDIQGPEVSDLVSSLHPGVGVLFMSGYPEDRISHSADSRERPFHFIAKPFTKEAFLAKVKCILG